LWLVKNNVPFDVAFSLDDTTRTAFAIMFSEMEGNKFDWDLLDYVKREGA